MSASDETPGPPPRRNLWALAGELMAIAFEFTGSAAAGVAVGYFADRQFDTEPWLLIVFTLLGTGAGFYRMLQILQHLQRRLRRDGD